MLEREREEEIERMRESVRIIRKDQTREGNLKGEQKRDREGRRATGKKK